MKYEPLVMHLKSECKGRKNAKKGSELEHSLHISGNELRRRVNRLRREGVPIGCHSWRSVLDDPPAPRDGKWAGSRNHRT